MFVGLEREVESERRKTRDAQTALREKDKEYQKLKVFDYYFAAIILIYFQKESA